MAHVPCIKCKGRRGEICIQAATYCKIPCLFLSYIFRLKRSRSACNPRSLTVQPVTFLASQCAFHGLHIRLAPPPPFLILYLVLSVAFFCTLLCFDSQPGFITFQRVAIESPSHDRNFVCVQSVPVVYNSREAVHNPRISIPVGLQQRLFLEFRV